METTCPYCGEAYVVVKKLQQELDTLLRVVFRDFPLTTMHPHALQAAEAAEAAAGQGKFWGMHDRLFEHQDALELNDLMEYSSDLKLDMTRFVHDMTEHTYVNCIDDDVQSGVRSGVNGTPTFFINGMRHEGLYDFNSLLAAVREVAAR